MAAEEGEERLEEAGEAGAVDAVEGVVLTVDGASETAGLVGVEKAADCGLSAGEPDGDE